MYNIPTSKTDDTRSLILSKNQKSYKKLKTTLASHWMIIYILNCKSAGINFVSFIVRNLQLKFFLKSHYNFDFV